MHVGKRDIGAHRPQSDGAVHGAGIDIEIAEFFGDAARDGAFSGAGWSVDGDSDSLGQIL